MEKPRVDPPDPPEIETPIIQTQDLEHNPGPLTRVSNSGVKVEPKFDDADERDFASEHEAAIEALEEFEKSMRQLPPG